MIVTLAPEKSSRDRISRFLNRLTLAARAEAELAHTRRSGALRGAARLLPVENVVDRLDRSCEQRTRSGAI